MLGEALLLSNNNRQSTIENQPMSAQKLRIGLIGAGGNTRLRHIPGLRALPDVEIVAVCNRRASSTQEVAREYDIPRTFEKWQDLVQDPEIDAVVIGTWPYLHCPITLLALESEKHVMTEARMSMNAREAHQILAASRKHHGLVCQIVPSPFGLKGHRVMKELIDGGFLGELRDVRAYDHHDALNDDQAPLSWRQSASLSGFNMLTLGILHETLLRWAPPPVRVMAQVHAHIPKRIDPESGARTEVGTPDSVQVLTILENGARGIYQFSGVTSFGQGRGICLMGTDGILHYDMTNEQIHGVTRSEGQNSAGLQAMREIPIPEEKAMHWRVEEEFVQAIREGAPIEMTDFVTGVAYMEFTEAVARSAEEGSAVDLPLFIHESGSKR